MEHWSSIVADGNRAGEVIQRVRALVNKTADQKAPLHINEVVNEVMSLAAWSCSPTGWRCGWNSPMPRPPVPRRPDPARHQVILNLVINGIEAIQPVKDRPRELVIRTQQDGQTRFWSR